MFFSTNKNVEDHDHSFCSNFLDDDPDHSLFDHLPISFFPFPSPFDDQFDEYDFMFCQQQIDKTPSNTINNNSDSQKKKKQKKMPIIRKRLLSKKDRHSKIKTARGVRDRRMRLSLPVARQFFELQDMLGFDKPSKVVEWLLIQSTPQILNISNFSTHFSNINYSHPGINQKIQSLKSDAKKKKQHPIRKTMDKKMRQLARARARARTMEKKSQHFYHLSLHQNFTKISSCAANHDTYNLNPPIVEVEKPSTTSTQADQPINIDYQFQKISSNFEIMAKWSPSDSTFNYLHHQTQNLDLQEIEFEDYNIFG